MRLLGVDVGSRRVGLAVSDATATLATPLRTLEVAGALKAAARAVATEVDRLQAEEDGLALIVVGLPRSLDGRSHGQTEQVLKFVTALRGCVPLPIELQDERLTSREAESRLAVQEKSWRRRKTKLDAAAAAIILQEYLDNQKGPDGGSR